MEFRVDLLGLISLDTDRNCFVWQDGLGTSQVFLAVSQSAASTGAVTGGRTIVVGLAQSRAVSLYTTFSACVLPWYIQSCQNADIFQA